MPAISVLVPIFNVEFFLEQCLNSIKYQTFKDFEVICINDGSTDNSLEIINKFVKNDNRFILINKNYSGYGHSMNLGLDYSSGDYIAIVESDDYIEINMLEILYNMAIQNNLDVARCNYYECINENRKKVDLSYIPENTVTKPVNDIIIFYQAPAIWVNLYRRSFLIDNKIKFLETPGASFQDTSFIFKVYALCERFMFTNIPLLNYRLDNSNSSVHNENKIFCVCDEYHEILNFIKKKTDVYELLKFHIPKLRFSCYAWNFSRIKQKDKMKFLKIWQKDVIEDFSEGRVNRKFLKDDELKKMKVIKYFPFLYKYRKAL